jgi:hypothetical protein
VVRALRWLGLGLLALLAAVLGLALAWALSQGPDAPPRALPAALELPPRAVAPSAVFSHLAQLHEPGDGAPVPGLDRPPLACDRGEGCATRWARDVPALAAQLQAHARLGQRCEAAWAARDEDGGYVEWLPQQPGPAAALPSLLGLTSCQRWLIGQALLSPWPEGLLDPARWEPGGSALGWQTWEADLRAAAGAPRAPSRIPLDPAP